MKLKQLLEHLNKIVEETPESLDWDIYTEEASLLSPPNHITFETYLDNKETLLMEYGEDYVGALEKSYGYIKTRENGGWKFLYDSEGFVYQDIASTPIKYKEKQAILIPNNY